MATKQTRREYFDELNKELFREYEVRSNGTPSGKYVEFYPSSSKKRQKKIETQITPDLRFVGRYKRYTPEGHLEIDGMLDKQGNFNGNVYQYDTKGHKIGRQLYAKNGNITFFPYNANGKLNGAFQEQDKDGNIIRTGFYKNGKKSGKWTEYIDGKPTVSYEYKHGQKNGDWTIFDENGNLKETGFYKNGMPCGQWSVYENGLCTKVASYDEIKGRDISLECENAEKYYQKTFAQFFDKETPVYTFKMNEDVPELTTHRSLSKQEREQGVRAIFKYLSTHEIDLNTEFGAEGFSDQKDLQTEFKKLIKAARENGDNSPEAQKCDRWIGRGLHNIYANEQNKREVQNEQVVQQTIAPQPTASLSENISENASSYGRNALHYWADRTEPHMFETSFQQAQAILSEYPEYLNAKSTDGHGVTPLMCAVNKGNEAMIDLLLSYRADINKTNDFGETPVMYAARNGNADLVKKMARNGANLLIKAQEGSDYAGKTILQIMEDNGYLDQMNEIYPLFAEQMRQQTDASRKAQPLSVGLKHRIIRPERKGPII
ncbi:MAG: ankyrin repeat domain-containing protein, partial [Alphaproteobacteria bacterium]|nr:ankyrin repeat domain-containing protein [Alphaproteobacteria bacterium]